MNTYQNPYNYQQMGQYTFVNGISGALDYRLPPNSTIILMDNNEPAFYLKTTNAMGQATMKKYKFEEVSEQVSSPYVTVEQFNELTKKLDSIIKIKEKEKNESTL